MKRIGFEELSEDDLFWMGQTDNPRGPHEFWGPYKKKVYQEMRGDVPPNVYVKTESEWWGRLRGLHSNLEII